MQEIIMQQKTVITKIINGKKNSKPGPDDY
jgi:hypothetical protein